MDMTTIGKVQASGLSATQESTLALVNINADFSIAKIEAPLEYRGISSALTSTRRYAAEVGRSHILARRLGTLFRGILPQVPTLVETYGKRASAIAQHIDAGISSKQRFGAFREHVGVDVTSLWAAATSGTAAITANLLACLLARAWDAPEAVAIWRELVDERKSRLRSNIDIAPDEVACVVQEIEDKDLEQWDASARAWLKTADESSLFRRQQIQVKVILTGLDVVIDHNFNVYESVTRAWTTALDVMDKIISGANYSIQDGAVLALSSWHIYPDLVLLQEGAKNIKQQDELVPISGAVSIGLVLSDGHPDIGKGVNWTLSLSRLKFYGPQVEARSNVDVLTDRISLEDFDFVVIGAILEILRIKTPAQLPFIEIFSSLDAESTGWYHLTGFKGSDSRSHTWLDLLRNASRAYLQASSEARQAKERSLSLGRRHWTHFRSSTEPPLTDLRAISSLLRVLKYLSFPLRVEYLRTLFLLAGISGKVLMLIKDTIKTGQSRIYVSLGLIESSASIPKAFIEYAGYSTGAGKKATLQQARDLLPGFTIEVLGSHTGEVERLESGDSLWWNPNVSAEINKDKSPRNPDTKQSLLRTIFSTVRRPRRPSVPPQQMKRAEEPAAVEYRTLYTS